MSEPRRSRLIVLAGPTAVGKGTVAAEVRRHHPEVWLSVSATTRDPRPGEENGVHYWFVSDDDFDAMIERGDLLEWATVHGTHRYGTPRGPVELALASESEFDVTVVNHEIHAAAEELVALMRVDPPDQSSDRS